MQKKENGNILPYLMIIITAGQSLYKQYNQMRYFQNEYSRPIHSMIKKAQDQDGQFFIVNKSPMYHAFFDRVNFDLPFLSLIYSQSSSDKPVSIVPIMDENERLLAGLDSSEFIFRNNEVKARTWLNKKYFYIDGEYTILK
jgi:hypothetical protein